MKKTIVAISIFLPGILWGAAAADAPVAATLGPILSRLSALLNDGIGSIGDADHDQLLEQIGRISSDGSVYSAITDGNLEKVQRIFARGEDLKGTVGQNILCDMGILPLEAAVASRKPAIVGWLLETQGANANIVVERGRWSALHTAVNNGDRDIAEALLTHGAAVNAEYTMVPLHIATHHAVVDCKAGAVDCLELLLKHGAVPDVENRFGKTPLCLAQDKKRADVAAILVAYGADAEKLKAGADADEDDRAAAEEFYARVVALSCAHVKA